MIIIGEKLNSSIPRTFEAMQARDDAAIIAIATAQERCGAHYLDVNTAMFGEEELAVMQYVLPLLMAHTSCGIMLDSPSPAVIEGGIGLADGRDVILNSVTLTDRLEEVLPIALAHHTGVVGLPIDDEGIPNEVERRVANALKLAAILLERGIPADKIFIDILAESVALDSNVGMTAIRTAQGIRMENTGIHLTCGLSNVSFGLPKRGAINAAFLTALICAGADSAIMDITSPKMQEALLAANLIAGLDEYCMDYIEHNRPQE